MWRRRTKSITRVHSTNFSCSSFKDIQALCAADDSKPDPKNSARKSVFHRVRAAQQFLRAFSGPGPGPEPDGPTKPKPLLLLPAPPQPAEEPVIALPGAEKRVVVYFTSLRVVRRTFEDCSTVRSILRGLRVLVDERDVSMDAGFMGELQRIMSLLGQPDRPSLPRIFIGGRYIGGVEELRCLNETGELKKCVAGLADAPPGACEACGGYRFVLCDNCCGSHKYYSEKGGFKSCTTCNENGLIRCPSCCSCEPF